MIDARTFARRSFFATVLAMGEVFGTRYRFGVRIPRASEIPAFVPCRRWKRRGLELAKRRVRQQGLRA